MQRLVFLSFLPLSLLACGDDDGGGVDMGAMDSAVDAAAPDTGVPDSGAPDGGSMDAGPVDGGPADTGVDMTADARPADSGPADAGPIACESQMVGDCESPEAGWAWFGGACNAARVCPGEGFSSLGACRVAYAECGARSVCDGLPSFLDGCVDGVVSVGWTGEECMPGCDYLAADTPVYASQEECEMFTAACGE